MIKVNVTQIENGLLSKLQEKTSSWAKLKRLTATVLVVSKICLKRHGKISSPNPPTAFGCANMSMLATLAFPIGA